MTTPVDLIGSIVDAVVVRAETYGVYLEFVGGTILVLIVDIADVPLLDCRLHFVPGQQLRVRIDHWIAAEQKYRGNIRVLGEFHPNVRPTPGQ